MVHRYTAKRHEARGVFCAIGRCTDCVMVVDGRPNVRTCMRMLSTDEVRELNPFLSDEVIGASWCPTDGHANPLRTTLAFYRRARALGVRFVTGVDVLGVRTVRGRARQVVTSVGVFEGDEIVLAAGLGTRRLAASVGIDVPMEKQPVPFSRLGDEGGQLARGECRYEHPRQVDEGEAQHEDGHGEHRLPRDASEQRGRHHGHRE